MGFSSVCMGARHGVTTPWKVPARRGCHGRRWPCRAALEGDPVPTASTAPAASVAAAPAASIALLAYLDRGLTVILDSALPSGKPLSFPGGRRCMGRREPCTGTRGGGRPPLVLAITSFFVFGTNSLLH